jgi:hypothetical protein
MEGASRDTRVPRRSTAGPDRRGWDSVVNLLTPSPMSGYHAHAQEAFRRELERKFLGATQERGPAVRSSG